MTIDRLAPHQLQKGSRFQLALERGEQSHDVVDQLAVDYRVRGGGAMGAIAAGALAHELLAAVADELSIPTLSFDVVSPIPDRAFDFAASLSELMIFEEGNPVVEDALIIGCHVRELATRVRGQRSGHVHALGVCHEDDLRQAFARELPDWRPLEFKERNVPADHPATKLFRALRQVRVRRQVTAHSCVGSTIEGSYPPYQVFDTAVTLGGSIGVALGAAKADRPAIAVLGDYALLHSGVNAHDLVHRLNAPVLTVIFSNGISAKTGGQPTPASMVPTDLDPVDLEQVLQRMTSPDRVHVKNFELITEQELTTTMLQLIEALPATLVLQTGDGLPRRASLASVP